MHQAWLTDMVNFRVQQSMWFLMALPHEKAMPKGDGRRQLELLSDPQAATAAKQRLPEEGQNPKPANGQPVSSHRPDHQEELSYKLALWRLRILSLGFRVTV